MQQKYYWMIGIVVVLAIIGIILINNYDKGATTGGIPIFRIASLTSSGRDYATAMINEPVNFKMETSVENGTVFRLVLPQGVEYVSGIFKQEGTDLVFEYTGENLITLTEYDFVVKGTTEGKHSLQVWAGVEDMPGLNGMNAKIGTRDYVFFQFEKATLCSAETLEKATELCLQVEATCETLECIEERTRLRGIIIQE